MKEKFEELMEIVDGRNINLTTGEMKRIVDAITRTIEWIETAEELKDLDVDMIDKMKQEYKDLGKKISTILEEQFAILREGRKKIKEEFENQ